MVSNCPETISKYIKDESLYKNREAERDKFYDHNMKLLEKTILEIKQLEGRLAKCTSSAKDNSHYVVSAMPYLNQSAYYEKYCHSDEFQTAVNSSVIEAPKILSNHSVVSYSKKQCSSVNTSLLLSSSKKVIKSFNKNTPKQIASSHKYTSIKKAPIPVSNAKKPKCTNCLVLLARGFSSANCPCHKRI